MRLRQPFNAPPVARLAAVRLLGRHLEERIGFSANELRGARGVHRYHLRHGSGPVLLRHRTVDIFTFEEVFHQGIYDLPSEVSAVLAADTDPTVIDLGANIGLFGAYMRSQIPRARITAFEPDPINAALHRRLIEAASARGAWVLEEACAGARDGETSFFAGRESASRMAFGAEVGQLRREVRDVLPLFGDASLVKLDAEGAEWELLADPRFGAAGSVVLEYHPEGCPSDDPATAARGLLTERGFEVVRSHDGPDGVGVLWAVSAS